MNYKLGLDIGNSGIKMAGKLSSGRYVLHNIKSLATYDASDNSHIVQLDGDKKPLYFSVGEPLTAQDKTKRPYLKHILLLGLATTYGDIMDCEKIRIGIGLPLIDFKNDYKRKVYQEKLDEITQVSGYVNNKYYLFNTEVTVFAEGFSAFYYISDELDKRYRWIIADHGYRSTDAVAVGWNSTANKWKVENYLSLNKGLLEMYGAISNQFSFDLKEDPLTAQDVEYYMHEKIKVVTENKLFPEVDLNDYSNGAVPIIENIYNELEIKFGKLSGRKILLMGGGAELVFKHLNLDKHILNKAEVSKRIYGNAIGFYLQL